VARLKRPPEIITFWPRYKSYEFSDDDRLFGAALPVRDTGVALLVWDEAGPGKGQASQVIDLNKTGRDPPLFVFTPESTKVVVLYDGSSDAITFEIKTGNLLDRWKRPGWIADLTNGQFVLFGAGRSLTLVDFTTGQTVFEVKPPPILSLTEAKISNDRRCIISISGGNAAQIWRVGEAPLQVDDWTPPQLLPTACA